MDVTHSPSANEKNTILIKIFGWALLVVGLVIIGWALISSYNIFTGKEAAPEVLKIKTEETSTVTQEKALTTSEAIQKEMGKMIEEQLKGVLPTDFFMEIFNLAIWSMLAFILIFGGSQISGLGIRLIKK